MMKGNLRAGIAGVMLALAPPLAALGQEAPLARYWASSGSLPPEYAWDVTVTVSAQGRLELRHCRGYATEGPACTTRRARVDAGALARIIDAAVASGLRERPAREPGGGEIPIGGRASGGTVWLDGAEIALPAFPARRDAERVGKVLAAIRGAIPARLVRRFLDGN